MTLPGGPADKLGNRYEKWWTLSEFIRMLHGDTEAIRIEDPGVEKAEFVVTTGTRRELHQVKLSHPTGKWSVAALRHDGLLEAIGKQLAGNNDRFVFASGSDARALSALCDAAKAAESVEELKCAFLEAKERKKNFEALLDDWECDPPTAIDILKRIEVRTIDERGLEITVRLAVPALFLTNSNKVVDALRAVAEDSVHRTITREELIDQLSQRGYQLRRLTSPASARAAISKATDRYVSGARARLIRQQLIPREAAKALLERMDDTATDSVMTGKAGSGKTACVVEVVKALRERGWPVLAFRLDRFVSASTTAELGGGLDLEESPPLVLTAAAEAAGLPGVLIVDQVDAVSTLSGRTSGAFDLVEQLLLEARGTRARVQLHVVVVCREFDWKNDPRLRQLIPSEADAKNTKVDVAEFTLDQVQSILTAAGFDPEKFRNRQLKILQLPQNLSLFLEAGFDVSTVPTFGTATEVFNRYWEAKRRLVVDRAAPEGDRWMEVMETLCEEMTSTQQLSVAKEKLDGFPRDYMSQLASEGVLTFDGRLYGFGHESFFDYCFARVFAGREEPLVAFLKESEQHLFRRAQVRQVLAYLREANPARYIKELRNLLADNGIRPHLKDLAFALLAEVQNPTDDEWAVWETWIEPKLKAVEDGTANQDGLSELAWRRFFPSRSWFAEVDRLGLVEHWLASENDRIIDKVAMDYLRVHQRHSPDRVATLLEPYADRGSEWGPRLRHLMQWPNHHSSRGFFELFLRLIDNGTLDDARGRSMLYNLGENRPEWIPEVLAHRLRRRLTVIRASGDDLRRGALLGYDHSAAEMFHKAAQHAPVAFVTHVLPVVLEVSDSAVIGDKPPRRDAVWPILVKTEYPDDEDACLLALTASLAALAREGTADLRGVIADLRCRDTQIANHLLLALYTGGRVNYADEAVSLLCDEPWRLQCGFSDSPHWCAMELIRAVAPHCGAKNRARLESVILGYVAPYERTRDGYKQEGRTSFALLSAIPGELRSTSANARFKELERKFGQPEGLPRGATFGRVRSPIDESATEEMADDHWLRAIAKYQSEDWMRLSEDDGLRGGASELAQVLEARVKEEPERFARLSLHFPVDANPVYLERTLSALKGAAITSDLKLEVCHKAFAESRSLCGRYVADVLGSVEEPLSDDAVHMLTWLATEHEDPASEAWKEDADGGQYYNGDIHMNGINTTRGRAAGAIRDLILIDAAYIDRFRPTLDRMVCDGSACVRSCVAETLRAVAYRDPVLGRLLFKSMDLSEDRLLATHHVYHFVLGCLRENFVEMKPIIKRMLRSSEDEVCEAGARLASIAAIEHESVAGLVEEAMHGTARHLLGVAQVAAANISEPECRVWCESKLVALFNDDDADVRKKAASCFRHLRDDTLETYGPLIDVFCDSRAYQEDSFWVLHALEKSRGRLPGMTCVACEKFFDRLSDEAKDIRTSRFGDTRTVTRLIFRTYQQHQDDEWTSPSLDLIDRLCLEGISDAGAEFEEFDR